MGPLRRGLREVGLGLITAGMILLLFVLYQLFGTGLAEAHSQSVLKHGFQQSLVANGASGEGDNPTVTTPGSAAPTTSASPTTVPSPTTTAPGGASPPVNGAIDHLVIPKIGVDKYVVEGTNDDDLRRGPGHYMGTVLPGQRGNAAIAGHRTTYGAPFFRLNELHAGDLIYVTDLEGRRWVYKVSQSPEVVSPSDVAVLNPTPYAQLTLTTCNPRFSATSRLVVVARLSGQIPVAAPKTPATTVPASSSPATLPGDAPQISTPTIDNLGSGNHHALWPALAFGALVVLAWVGVRLLINRTRRWRRLGVYVVGIAICLVPLWFCFENAALLLPQNF
jgi:sortase A